MNVVDVAIALLCLVAAARGWRKGLLGQVFEFGGGIAGLFAGVAIASNVASNMTNRPRLQVALVALAIVFVALSIGQTIGFLVGHRFGALARRIQLARIDQGMGAVLSVVVTLIVAWLVASLLAAGPSRAIARGIQRSQVLDLVSSTLPEPPNLLAKIRQYLDTAGFPQVFSGIPPAIGPPVDLPSGRLARRAVRAAEASTVRIVVPACGGTQLGSGWIVDADSVVTNAHVVAGGDEVLVQDRAGEHTGRVVLFDPDTDVAVVHVDGLRGPPLELDTTDHDRGTPGATLGYPGHRGGDLVVHRAAVQGRFPATGRDIYGESRVTREIYELRTNVRQGDSGGPFVLANGKVAGVIFAASTAAGDTGYALTGSEVSGEVRNGARRTEAVSTNGCTH